MKITYKDVYRDMKDNVELKIRAAIRDGISVDVNYIAQTEIAMFQHFYDIKGDYTNAAIRLILEGFEYLNSQTAN